MDEYIGIIRPFAATFTPSGWLPCDGRKISISGNETLFAIIGVMYGGDGSTNFALPNLNCRAVVGTGKGADLTLNRFLAQSGGAEKVTINVDTYPAHKHNSFGLTIDADSSDPKGEFLTKTPNLRYCINQGSDTLIKMGEDIISTAPGGNLPHENMPPYMAINYFICVRGFFPVRP